MTALARLSRGLARIEKFTGALLVAAIFLLMVGNVLFRALGRPPIWTDELAVNLMVWLAFVGASLAIPLRSHMMIGLLPDALSPKVRAGLLVASDALVLVFLLVMAAIIWRWLDLPGLIRAGSGAALAQETFNFIYTDPMLTLGSRKIWFWLILPLTSLTALVHATAILAEDLRDLRGIA